MNSSPTNALEAALSRAGDHPRFLAGGPDEGLGTDLARLASNFAAIEAELDAPAPSRLARFLLRVGVDERTVPLVTATPALRRSWFIAVIVAVLFALNAASTSVADPGVDRIIVFLTAAPLVPLLGVALAFGPAVDPTHEVAVAAPMDGFRLFLVRALTVVSASTGILLLTSLLVQEGGGYRIAWLLPALAATAVTMGLSTSIDPRAAAGAVAAGWLTIVLIVSQAADPAAAFGPVVQLTSLAVAVVATVFFFRMRRRLDLLSVR